MKKYKDLPLQERLEIAKYFAEHLVIAEYTCEGKYQGIINNFFEGSFVGIPVTYPQIPWQFIDKQWNWYAKDESGYGYFYQDKPEWGKYGNWVGKVFTPCTIFVPTTCKAEDSLTERPKDL